MTTHVLNPCPKCGKRFDFPLTGCMTFVEESLIASSGGKCPDCGTTVVEQTPPNMEVVRPKSSEPALEGEKDKYNIHKELEELDRFLHRHQIRRTARKLLAVVVILCVLVYKFNVDPFIFLIVSPVLLWGSLIILFHWLQLRYKPKSIRDPVCFVPLLILVLFWLVMYGFFAM